jgi:hypothetical protein
MSGCSIRAFDVQTITIPPQKEPVTVTVKGTATCRDNVLFYTVHEYLDVTSTDGQHVATNVPERKKAEPKQAVQNNPKPQSVSTRTDQHADLNIKLKRLKAAYDDGLITQSEYETKRAKILEEL